MAQQVLERSELKVEDTWKLEDIFASDELWEKAYKEVFSSCDALKQWKGTVTESGKNYLTL